MAQRLIITTSRRARRPGTAPTRTPSLCLLRYFYSSPVMSSPHLQDVFQDKDYDRSNAISLREFEAALPALG